MSSFQQLELQTETSPDNDPNIKSSISNDQTNKPSIAANMSAITRQLPKLTQRTSLRSFSVAAQRMAEGSSKGTPSQGDAFSKREKANEDYYVKQEEAKKLEALKKKIADSEAQLAKDKQEAEALGKK